MPAHAFKESERARASFARRVQRMAFVERRGELLVGGGFMVVAVALALVGEISQSFSLPIVALYVLGIAAASQVRFDIGAGFTVPTQAVFVPMLFAVPVSLVPLLVALALALGMAPGILSRKVPASRILTVPGNCWFTVGPALVLLDAHDRNPDGRWGILLLALHRYRTSIETASKPADKSSFSCDDPTAQ